MALNGGYEENLRKPVSITLLPDVLQKLDKLADAAGISRSRYIELMVKNYETEVNNHE